MTQPETVVIDGITLNALDENGEPKSAKQLDKEAKKAAKLLKLAQKNEKKAATAAVSATKEKVEVSDEITYTLHHNCWLTFTKSIIQTNYSHRKNPSKL